MLVAAIPRGGVPVTFQVAKRLRCEMDLVIPRKLPIPWNREAGFGAVTADGATVLNRSLVKAVGLHDDEVEAIAEEQRREVERLTEAYRRILPPMEMTGRPVAIIDDGLASGYTMLAAVESVRMRQPSEVIIAVPVASAPAARLVENAADNLICLAISSEVPFAVADFYVNWRDLTDEDIEEYLRGAAALREKDTRTQM
jgi:predicted phosphoribosyltransferase